MSKQPHTKKSPLLELFPAIKPYSTGYMKTEEPHEIYWEQCGNPDGIPVLFVHGGPGAGCSATHRQFFDPEHYRIILFDQRGAGRSTPHASLINNTRKALVDDIEKLREHLQIKKWHVFGGSWGSTLSLSYASDHANKILSLVLRGIFLLEQSELNWWFNHNKNVFPESWEQYISVIPDNERHNLLNAYYKRLTGDDKDAQLEAAIAWSRYEGSCASLIPKHEAITTEEQKSFALALSKIECHYFKNQMIEDEDSLLNNIDNFRHIPSVIIHGRYDMVCPIISAHRLHNAWPEADYIVVPDGGHSPFDPTMRSRLIEATETMKNL